MTLCVCPGMNYFEFSHMHNELCTWTNFDLSFGPTLKIRRSVKNQFSTPNLHLLNKSWMLTKPKFQAFILQPHTLSSCGPSIQPPFIFFSLSLIVGSLHPVVALCDKTIMRWGALLWMSDEIGWLWFLRIFVWLDERKVKYDLVVSGGWIGNGWKCNFWLKNSDFFY